LARADGEPSKKLITAAARLVNGDVGGPIDDAALAALGLVMADDAEPDAIEVWPENEVTVRTFIAMGTQWNVGAMGGAIGLRYESLPAVMRLTGVPRARQADVFAGLRIMERSALEELNRGR
jgi:hypothetical protein